MIRRVSKHNDLKDIIKSCPSGVIDDIYSIQYYIQGHNVVIDAEFTRVGDCLQAILPTNQLELLPNGILMRRAFYKVIDSSYPDGYYNLEFEDCMNIWLGDEESEEPVHPEYVTEDELSSTLSSYATKKFVTDRTDLLEEHDVILSMMISDCATKSWVSEQGYLTSHQDLTGYATESWVSEQGYLTSHQDLTGYATESWVESQGYITIENLPSGLATQSWVESNFVSAEELSGYVTQEDLADFVTHGDLEEYATQSWVEAQGYITSTGVSGLATQSWVSSNFLSSGALSSYATQSWVESQGYLTSHQDLTGYATQSWATSQFLEESKIWTGTESQWNQLTPAQKATYIIALITE